MSLSIIERIKVVGTVLHVKTVLLNGVCRNETT